MTPQQFADLARQGFNRIPVTREMLADLDAQLSSYLKQGPLMLLPLRRRWAFHWL
jgi:hypothetical protein